MSNAQKQPANGKHLTKLPADAGGAKLPPHTRGKKSVWANVPRLAPNFLLDTGRDAPLPRPSLHFRFWSIIIAVLMMTGVILGEVLESARIAPTILYSMLGVAGCLIAVALYCAHLGLSWRGWGVAAIGTVLLGMAGFGLDDARVAHITERVPDLAEGGFNITADIVVSEHYRGNRQRVILRPIQGLPEWHEGDRLRLVANKDIPPLTPGERIDAEIFLSPLPSRLLPDGFDFRRHAAEQGIVSGGFLRAIHGQHPDVTGANFSRLRTLFQRRIFASMHNEDAAAIASALLIGFRAATPSRLHESFRGAGLAHFLAISGLHMGLICGTIMVLVRSLLAIPHITASYFSSRKVAATISLPLCFLFLLFAGVPVSALRAFLMLALVLVAILISRRGITIHHVALAAIVVLLADPSSLFTPAFQMSFSAVFALVVAWNTWQIYRPLNKPNLAMRLLGYVLGIAATSLIASLASMPFVLYHFGVTTSWSVVANILGMPLMAFIIMPLGGIALMLAGVGLDTLPLLLMEKGIIGLIVIAEYFSSLYGARIIVPPPSAFATVCLAASLITLGIGKRYWRASAAVPLLLGLVLWYHQPVPVAAVVVLYNKPLLAVLADDGELVVSTRQNSDFAKRILASPFGRGEVRYIRERADADCGNGYCAIDGKAGWRVAIVWHRSGLTAACREAHLVLSLAEALYPCRRGILVDRGDIAASGGMLIYPDARQDWVVAIP